jgi:membrane-associated phospholipid phosphatase
MIVQVLFAVYWAMSWGQASIVPAMVAAHVIAIFVPVAMVHLVAGEGRVPTAVRQLYPVLFIGIHWTELGIIHNLLHDTVYDSLVIVWDLALFGVHLQAAWLPAMPYVWLSEIMLFMYFSYYLLVFGTPLFVAIGGSKAATKDLVFRIVVTYMVCFAIYLFFPVEGPRSSVGHTQGPHMIGFFYQLVEGVAEAGDSLGTAFPSSHVAGVVTVAIASVMWLKPWARALLITGAIGVTISTVYTQHHFAIDALAGIVLAAACNLVVPRLSRSLMKLPLPGWMAGGS